MRANTESILGFPSFKQNLRHSHGRQRCGKCGQLICARNRFLHTTYEIKHCIFSSKKHCRESYYQMVAKHNKHLQFQNQL